MMEQQHRKFYQIQKLKKERKNSLKQFKIVDLQLPLKRICIQWTSLTLLLIYVTTLTSCTGNQTIILNTSIKTSSNPKIILKYYIHKSISKRLFTCHLSKRIFDNPTPLYSEALKKVVLMNIQMTHQQETTEMQNNKAQLVHFSNR